MRFFLLTGGVSFSPSREVRFLGRATQKRVKFGASQANGDIYIYGVLNGCISDMTITVRTYIVLTSIEMCIFASWSVLAAISYLTFKRRGQYCVQFLSLLNSLCT